MADVFLLDTNVICTLADATRAAHSNAVSRFRQISRQNVLLPSVAVGEIEFGMQKAPDLRPEKRQELRGFIARFAQLPFDEHCVQPYAAIRAELWRRHGTPKAGKSHLHKERRVEELNDRVTGADLGVDEPDLYIASIALAQNLVLVTDDQNAGMVRVKEAADSIFQQRIFPVQLRTANWLEKET
jgi:predicted nucleic acid-binding protein